MIIPNALNDPSEFPDLSDVDAFIQELSVAPNAWVPHMGSPTPRRHPDRHGCYLKPSPFLAVQKEYLAGGWFETSYPDAVWMARPDGWRIPYPCVSSAEARRRGFCPGLHGHVFGLDHLAPIA